MKQNSDTAKCLKILQRVGLYGIHSFHLNQEIGTTRCAARIQDLKDKGYDITSTPEKLGDAVGVRYFLNKTPATQEKQKKEIRGYFDNERNCYVVA